MLIEKTCVSCQRKIKLDVPERGYADWLEGEHIQYAMPGLSADEREILISGVCGSCFDEACEPEDEDNPPDYRFVGHPNVEAGLE